MMMLLSFSFILSVGQVLSTPAPLTIQSGTTITASTVMNNNYLPSYAFDGISSTQWISGACRAGGWKSNQDLNLFTDLCSNGLCSTSCDVSSSSLSQSNDLNVYTATTIPISHSEARSWVRYDFPSGPVSNLTSIYIRGSWAVNTSLYGILPTSELTLPLATFDQSLTYQDISLMGPFPPLLSGLYLQANSKDGLMTGYCYAGIGDCQTFTITEIAIQKAPCSEELTIDLGSNRLLFSYLAKYSGFVNGLVLTSIDGLTYIPRITLGQAPVGSTQVPFPSNVVGRFVKFRSDFFVSLSSLFPD
jgi:hypothetical protein